MCDDKMAFQVGEIREITQTVSSIVKNETVVIASSEYELTKEFNGVLVSEGKCEIKGNVATALLEFNEKGTFCLRIISRVGREKVISKTQIEVE